MRASMAAVLGVVASAPVLAEPHGDARLAAFAEACLDGYRDPAVRSAAIRAAGWQPAADDADPELAAMMQAARAALDEAEVEDGMTGSAAVYARPGADGALYLVTTEMTVPADGDWKTRFLACHLYDFAATAPIDPALISARFGVEPAETVDQPGVIEAEVWNLDGMEGVGDLSHTFIPEGSPAAAVTGFTGVTLKLTSTRE